MDYGTKADFPPTKECALFAACDLNDVELLCKFYLKGAYSVPIVSELMLELEPYAKNDYIKEALSGSLKQFDRDKALLQKTTAL